MYKIQVIIGATRQGRFGDKPAKIIFEDLKKIADVEAELLDLRDYPLPFFDEPVSPNFITEPYSNPQVAKWTKKIAEADAYIIVTPEYNHGYPAVLKNAIDYVGKEWNNKPIAFVSYGAVAGGTRAVQQLRQVVVDLQMTPIRAGVHIVNYWDHLDEKGELKPDAVHGAQALFDQLLWWTKALKTARG